MQYRRFPVVIAFLLIFTSAALAQTGGTITGSVSDQMGALIPGVSVELTITDTDEQIDTITEVDGSYRFENVPPGPAEVTFRLINFTTVRRALTVSAGGTVTADAVLVVSASADITITAPRTFRNLAELENPAENLVGVASAASEGAITDAQLSARPVNRAAEVLETVPGLIISQHSGEGKANQYYLRGFNLDHGFDFAQTIAGVPVNMPTHAHAQGYADSNFLIPELVSGVQYRKGPYYAEEGDFSSAGAANINYFNRLDEDIFSVSGGSDNYLRMLGATSPQVSRGYLLTAFEFVKDEGPWESPNDQNKYNGILRYSEGDSRNGFSITAMGFKNHWHSTDQIPQRAIDSGLIGRFGFIEESDGGETFRYTLAGDWQRSDTNHSTRINGYVLRYGVQLFHNFTYFLNNPANGDQFEQFERRWTVGGQVTHRRLSHFGDYDTENAFGVEFRRDSVSPLGLYSTTEAQRTSTVREDNADVLSVGMFAQSQIEWSRVVRTTVGLRADIFHYNVVSDNPLNSGTANTGIISPKFTAVFGPFGSTELYANWGLGFHSNSALGATLTVDPFTGAPAQRSTPVVRSQGAEFGARTVAIRGLQTTATFWYLDFDSELVFVGDSGSTQAGPPSRRFGVELTNYYAVTPWTTVDLDLAFSRARYVGVPADQQFVPGALNRVLTAGVTVEPPEDSAGPVGSIRLRHFGPRPLLEDNSVESRQTTIVNGEIGYKFSDKMRLVLEGFNLFDARVSDIEYYYASRLPGEPLGGVNDIHLHPALPRMARITLRFGV